MGEGRQHRDLDMRVAEPAVGQARPQDRMHLGHVRAPQHEGVGVLEIVVAAHRLVHAEGAHEGVGGRRHAVAGVGVEIVGAEAGAHQLGRGIALEDRPLAGAEHADRRRPLFLQHLLALLGHHVEGLVPGDRLELAVLVVDAVALAQQRRGQPVGAVHDLGQEIALDAVEAAIDLGLHVAVGGDDLAVLDADHDAATGAAEAAGRLRPFDLQRARRRRAPAGRRREARCPAVARRDRRGMRLQELAAVNSAVMVRCPPLPRYARTPCWRRPRRRASAIVGEAVAHLAGARALDHDDDLAVFDAHGLRRPPWPSSCATTSSAIRPASTRRRRSICDGSGAVSGMARPPARSAMPIALAGTRARCTRRSRCRRPVQFRQEGPADARPKADRLLGQASRQLMQATPRRGRHCEEMTGVPACLAPARRRSRPGDGPTRKALRL